MAPLHAQLHEEISSRKRVIALAKEATGKWIPGSGRLESASARSRIGTAIGALRSRVESQAAIARARLVQFNRVFGQSDSGGDRSGQASLHAASKSRHTNVSTRSRMSATSGRRLKAAVTAATLSENPLVLDAMRRFGGASYGQYPATEADVELEMASNARGSQWLKAQIDAIQGVSSRQSTSSRETKGASSVSGAGVGARGVRLAWSSSEALSALWDEILVQMECIQRCVAILEKVHESGRKSGGSYPDSRGVVALGQRASPPARRGMRSATSRETPERGSSLAATTNHAAPPTVPDKQRRQPKQLVLTNGEAVAPGRQAG